MSSSKLQSALELTLPATIVADHVTVQDEVLSLFDECGPGLHRYVRSFGLGTEPTEDVVQETFLLLFRHLRLGRPKSNLKGWLFRVAHNLALKQRQRIQRRQGDQAWDASLAEQVIDPAANPEERMADDQRRRRLRSVARAMPDRDRQCLYLRAEGLRYRDIARTLGISLGTVAKSLTRSFARLTNADER